MKAKALCFAAVCFLFTFRLRMSKFTETHSAKVILNYNFIQTSDRSLP